MRVCTCASLVNAGCLSTNPNQCSLNYIAGAWWGVGMGLGLKEPRGCGRSKLRHPPRCKNLAGFVEARQVPYIAVLSFCFLPHACRAGSGAMSGTGGAPMQPGLKDSLAAWMATWHPCATPSWLQLWLGRAAVGPCWCLVAGELVVRLLVGLVGCRLVGCRWVGCSWVGCFPCGSYIIPSCVLSYQARVGACRVLRFAGSP